MNTMNSMKMGPVEWFLLVVLAAIWGGSFFFNKVALADMRPFTVVAGRVGLGALALIIMVYATGNRLPGSLTTWRHFLVMGCLNNLVPFSLIVWGQQYIAAGLAAILNASTPLFTVVLAHFLTRDERADWGKLFGAVFGLVGVAVMIGFQSLQGLGGHVAAQAAVVAAAVSYAVGGIYGRRLRGISPITSAAGQVICSSLMILPLAVLVDKPWTRSLPGLAAVGSVAGLAVVCTAVAYSLYFKILSRAGATNLLLVTLLIPVSANLLGFLYLGEKLSSQHFWGMAMIGAALAFIDGRPAARLFGWTRLGKRNRPAPQAAKR